MGTWFSKKHLWVQEENETEVTVGLTPYAIEQLGRIMFVNLPEVEERIELNECFGDVESIKTVSDMISPVAGVVVEINEAVQDAPELLNENAFDNWLVKVAIAEKSEELIDEREYKKFLEEP